jgi:hypothetical protein
MPAQDRTGPLGQGPLTGRGLGPCGQGLRRGLGRGFGFRRGLGARGTTLTEKEEKQLLQEELKEIETDKAEIEKRLKELK